MKRTLLALLFLLACTLIVLCSWNYLSIWQPVSQTLSKDERNSTINVATYYQYAINPTVLVFDLRSVSATTSQADVMRVFFQTADSLHEKSFDQVILAYKGTAKFMVPGDHFKKIGVEYSWQNPVLLTRTFAQNVTDLNGERAFSTWTGGLFAVVKNQLDDLGSLHRQWYLNDWLTNSP